MRSAMSRAGVAATLALAVVGLLAGPAQAATRVVGPGDSIQAAIDAAQPGDTIVVLGVHHENVAITKDGITLRGIGAVLEPAATPLVNVCSDPSAPDEVNGICIVGDVDFDTGTMIREIQNVTVSGFTVSGFNEGIAAFGAHNATFQRNVAKDNEEYGITAFVSTGTRFMFNRTSGAEEAGIYIGATRRTRLRRSSATRASTTSSASSFETPSTGTSSATPSTTTVSGSRSSRTFRARPGCSTSLRTRSRTTRKRAPRARTHRSRSPESASPCWARRASRSRAT
jgi:nitrous oxidase accessory protein NosD